MSNLPDGSLKVLNDIKVGFQFPDLTSEALSLCRLVEVAVLVELKPNIKFIRHFDAVRHGLEDLVEWPHSHTGHVHPAVCAE
ncbi:MAG: hypothetical protein F4Z18_05370 [Caldilineaceae bacterium SB0666_bin_21]|nr:hypothetical protein [Caldilineaceae bacterium SB0666_bin_21]